MPLPSSNGIIIHSSLIESLSAVSQSTTEPLYSHFTFEFPKSKLTYRDPDKLFSNPRYQVMNRRQSTCHDLYDLKISVKLDEVMSHKRFKRKRMNSGGVQVLVPMYIHYITTTPLVDIIPFNLPDLIIDVDESGSWMISECAITRESKRNTISCECAHSPGLTALDIVPTNYYPRHHPGWFRSFTLRDNNLTRIRVTTSSDVSDQLEGKMWINITFVENLHQHQPKLFLIGLDYKHTGPTSSLLEREQNRPVMQALTRSSRDEAGTEAGPKNTVRSSYSKTESTDSIAAAAANATVDWRTPGLFFSTNADAFDMGSSNDFVINNDTTHIYVHAVIDSAPASASATRLRVLYFDTAKEQPKEVPTKEISVRQMSLKQTRAPEQQQGDYVFEIELLSVQPSPRKLMFQFELYQDEKEASNLDGPPTHSQPAQEITAIVPVSSQSAQPTSGSAALCPCNWTAFSLAWLFFVSILLLFAS